MHYDKTIFGFTIGKVVRRKRDPGTPKGTGLPLVGHVMGFELNRSDEVVVTVKFANGEQVPVHPKNLSTNFGPLEKENPSESD